MNHNSRTGSESQYAYAANDPVNNVDPSGEITQWVRRTGSEEPGAGQMASGVDRVDVVAQGGRPSSFAGFYRDSDRVVFRNVSVTRNDRQQSVQVTVTFDDFNTLVWTNAVSASWSNAQWNTWWAGRANLAPALEAPAQGLSGTLQFARLFGERYLAGELIDPDDYVRKLARAVDSLESSAFPLARATGLGLEAVCGQDLMEAGRESNRCQPGARDWTERAIDFSESSRGILSQIEGILNALEGLGGAGDPEAFRQALQGVTEQQLRQLIVELGIDLIRQENDERLREVAQSLQRIPEDDIFSREGLLRESFARNIVKVSVEFLDSFRKNQCEIGKLKEYLNKLQALCNAELQRIEQVIARANAARAALWREMDLHRRRGRFAEARRAPHK
ncbi:MAG: hypothetical protein KF847_21120, partial [Pirellulales bacterium]|nr:hypothetical protein [Pirellulales bacterium]